MSNSQFIHTCTEKEERLHQTSLVKRLPNDNVFDCIEDRGYVVCIGGTGDVAVNLLLGVSILGLELVLDEHGAGLVSVPAGVVIEAHRQRHLLDLLGEQVTLVQEEDHGCVPEPPGIADFLKQVQGFHHPVGVLILVEHLVVLADGGDEKDSRDILKAVNPLLSLVPLATDIVHLELVAINHEIVLHDTSCSHTAPQDILFCWEVGRVAHLIDLVKEVSSRVSQLIQGTVVVGGLNARVLPQGTDMSTERLVYVLVSFALLYSTFGCLVASSNRAIVGTLLAQCFDRSDHVVENNTGVGFTLCLWESLAIDDNHLLKKSRFAGFPSAEEKQFVDLLVC